MEHSSKHTTYNQYMGRSDEVDVARDFRIGYTSGSCESVDQPINGRGFAYPGFEVFK